MMSLGARYENKLAVNKDREFKIDFESNLIFISALKFHKFPLNFDLEGSICGGTEALPLLRELFRFFVVTRICQQNQTFEALNTFILVSRKCPTVQNLATSLNPTYCWL